MDACTIIMLPIHLLESSSIQPAPKSTITLLLACPCAVNCLCSSWHVLSVYHLKYIIFHHSFMLILDLSFPCFTIWSIDCLFVFHWLEFSCILEATSNASSNISIFHITIGHLNIVVQFLMT